MGQYHKAINLTKGEFLSPNCGAKLMEHSYYGNDYTMRLTQLLASRGKWHGDEIVIAGDYSEVEDCAIPDAWSTPEMLEQYRQAWICEEVESHMSLFISNGVWKTDKKGKRVPNTTIHSQSELEAEKAKAITKAEAKFQEYGSPDIYDFATVMFKQVKITKQHEKQFDELRTSGLPPKGYSNLVASLQKGRYFVNHTKQEYIDSMDAIPQDTTNNSIPVADWYIFPLTILLSIANGRGGGDYRGYTRRTPDGKDYLKDDNDRPISVVPGEEYIGHWAGDNIAATPIVPAGYKHINPGFTEREHPIVVRSMEQELALQFPNIFSTKTVGV